MHFRRSKLVSTESIYMLIFIMLLTALLAQIKQLLGVFFINKIVSRLMTVKVTSVFRDSHCPCSWRQTHHHKHDNQAAAEVRQKGLIAK